MSICLVDVMNSKAYPHHNRRSLQYNDSMLWSWYARESRIYNAVYDEEKGRYVKGQLWFCNIIAFDFDVSDDVVNGLDLQQEFLRKITSLLGTPKYIITNKEHFSEWQEEKYFTRYNPDGSNVIKRPKKFGCQVVYELKDSLKSQYVEQVKLYQKIRLFLTKKVGADENFKGHMMKNWQNTALFNVQENESEPIDLKAISLRFRNQIGLDTDFIERVFDAKAFENFDDKLPKALVVAGSKLSTWYIDLNTWKGHFGKDNSSIADSNVIGSNKVVTTAAVGIPTHNFKITSSRNETLFNWLRSLSSNALLDVSYADYIQNTILYKNCDISEPLQEFEFVSTKESVQGYFEKEGFNTNDDALTSISDNSVIKIKQNPINADFVVENSVRKYFEAAKCDQDFAACNILPRKLSCVFMKNPELFLSNIRSLMTPDFLSLVRNYILGSESECELYGDSGLYGLIKSALYVTHFTYYNSIRRKRATSTNGNSVNSAGMNTQAKFVRKRANTSLMKYLGFNHHGHIQSFSRYIRRLKDMKLLNGNKPFSISFYQQLFHCKNTIVSRWIAKIRQWISSNEIHIIRIFNIEIGGVFSSSSNAKDGILSYDYVFNSS